MRKEYLSLRKNMNDLESYATEMYEILDTTYKEVNKIDVKSEDPVVAEEKLYNIVIGMETRMNSVNQKISSVEKDMDRLRKEENNLHKEMMNKYPKMTQEEMKVTIREHLKKKNLL